MALSGVTEGKSLVESRVTRAEALARTLEGEIVTAVFSPGERIGTKDDLRQRFGLAVATINEAVRLMEMRGLVAVRPGPGGGLFVTDAPARAAVAQLILGPDWSRATLADCVEVRDALEPLICRHAARHHTEQDLRALHETLERMRASTSDPRAYFEANWEFHRRLAAACRNAPLRSAYLLMTDFLEAGLSDYEADVIEPYRAQVHEQLLAAIEDGDMPALERAIVAHLEQSPLTASRAERSASAADQAFS
jgi:DNA-binding FadR family transcriptional regulator